MHYIWNQNIDTINWVFFIIPVTLVTLTSQTHLRSQFCIYTIVYSKALIDDERIRHNGQECRYLKTNSKFLKTCARRYWHLS